MKNKWQGSSCASGTSFKEPGRWWRGHSRKTVFKIKKHRSGGWIHSETNEKKMSEKVRWSSTGVRAATAGMGSQLARKHSKKAFISNWRFDNTRLLSSSALKIRRKSYLQAFNTVTTMPACWSKISKTTFLREYPGGNTPNLPHIPYPISRAPNPWLWMQQKCTDTTQSGYLKDPRGFLYLCYVKSLSTYAWPDRTPGQRKIKARSFGCIFYQIHTKNIYFFGNDKFTKTTALAQCICGGLAFCPQTSYDQLR